MVTSKFQMVGLFSTLLIKTSLITKIARTTIVQLNILPVHSLIASIIFNSLFTRNSYGTSSGIGNSLADLSGMLEWIPKTPPAGTEFLRQGVFRKYFPDTSFI